ncbi:bifunctional 2-dehydro-3-deoxygluconokinase/2-dehydro-3-deoxygalactonoki nase [Anaerolineales bacterium]
MRYDLITLGETMLRFTPYHHQRIEQSHDLQIHVGGSESNIAAGMARLGHPVAWLSRLTANPIGYTIANTLRANGVDTSHVVWTNEDRNGLYFLEEGSSPRSSQVIYDRANSAMSRMQREDLPVHLFQPDQAKIFHTSGITITIGAQALTEHAVNLAKSAGLMISFDFNYRAKLASPTLAARVCEFSASQADLLFIPLRDVITLYELDPHTNLAAAQTYIHERFPQALIIMTNGADDCHAISAAGERFQHPSYPVEMVSRLGAGDAFVAGFLHSLLQSDDPGLALQWASLAAAYKLSHPGDIPMWDQDSLANLLRGSANAKIQR